MSRVLRVHDSAADNTSAHTLLGLPQSLFYSNKYGLELEVLFNVDVRVYSL